MIAPLLERRLATLERQNRLWRALALCGLGFLLLGGWTRQDEVLAAQRFELVDDEGRVRAEMGIDEDGSAGFFVRDPEGLVRASLIQDASQAAMYLFDEDGTIRVGAAQYAHGGGGFALHGEDSAGGAVLYLKKSTGSLTFYDAEGNVHARLPD